MLETVQLIRDIFFRCFVVSFIYYVFVSVFYVANIDWLENIVSHYYRLYPTDTHILCGHYLSWLEVITFNFLLIPTIGLHWTSYAMKK